MKKSIVILCAVALLTGFSTVASADLAVGLVAYYPFDGNAQDATGNRHDGTVYGAIFAMDRFGKESSAYSFNGIDNYIDFGDILDNVFCADTAQFTISGWAKTSVMGNVYGEGNLIIGKSAGGSGPRR